MDWSSLKPLAGQLAAAGLPTLGGILGGLIPFPGGAIAGQLAGEWAGKAIAEALGVPATPDAVGAAINGMSPGEMQTQLGNVEQEAAAKWGALAEIVKAQAADNTAQSQAINETQRAELARGVSFWHWRHLIGYLVIFYGLQQIVLTNVVVFGFTKVTLDQLAQLFNSQAILTGGLFALLGYVAQDTTKKAIAAITGEAPPSIASTVVRAVLPAKRK